ncbi:MAG: hypothetical protein FIA92_09610 [Chloroflexi bacterium]|nr:hypothetical protein [Chloroflexota bacterium]
MYEPAIIAFILVAIVGGIAVIMGISADWEVSHELSRVTDRWTQPVVVRRYDGGPAGRQLAQKEAAILGDHGYQPSGAGLPSQTAPGEQVLVTFVLDSTE